jgi:MFS transporter, DHA2 family, methylenomycin A resistance protein
MRGKLLELHQVSAMCSRWSPVLPVPPLTSTLLGSVEKSRSGIAAGVLNATRQTGSVLGVALFGSLAGQANAFMAGMHASLMISACLLLAAGAAIWRGATSQKEGSTLR